MKRSAGGWVKASTHYASRTCGWVVLIQNAIAFVARAAIDPANAGFASQVNTIPSEPRVALGLPPNLDRSIPVAPLVSPKPRHYAVPHGILIRPKPFTWLRWGQVHDAAQLDVSSAEIVTAIQAVADYLRDAARAVTKEASALPGS